VTLSVEAMFQHQAKGPELLGVGEPRAVVHPGRVGRALPPDHQEHRAARPGERFVHKVPLEEREGEREGERFRETL